MFLLYTLVGAIIGFLSGMFGVGGSAIITPILKLLFNIPDLIAIASPLPVIIPAAMSGSYNYWKSGVIRKDIALAAIIGGLPATILGSLATIIVSSKWLLILTGLFVITVGIRLLKKEKERNIILLKNKIFSFTILIGITAGFVSGLLAVGGGIILIPAFILLLGLTMQEAAATSLFCIAFYAVPGSITHSLLGHIDWSLALGLSAGVIPASYLGSKVALAVESRKLQVAFSLLLIFLGMYFIFKQII